MSVDVSANGKTLIFDLLGDLYSLPITGGEAVPLTTGRPWDQAPRFSPDGESVYFVSDREDFKSIWRLTIADGELERVTSSGSDIMGTPNWTQDGSALLAGLGDVRSQNSDVILQSINPSDGQITPINAPSVPAFDWVTRKLLRPNVAIYSAAQSPDGQVYYAQSHWDDEQGRFVVRLSKFDLVEQELAVITPLDASYSEFKPQLSHNGNLVAYFRQYQDRHTEVRILNRTTGHDAAVMELDDVDDASYGASNALRPNYAFTPDDRELVFWHNGKIHRLELESGMSKIIPFKVAVEREVWQRAMPNRRTIENIGTARIIRWPSLSRDGQTMAFASIGYIWTLDVGTGRLLRLTSSSDYEYMPAISPDGRSIAYISFADAGNEYGAGRLVVSDIDGRHVRDLLVDPNATYLLPSWSYDSDKIAVIQEIDSSNGPMMTFGWTSATQGNYQQVAEAPVAALGLSLHIYARYVGFDASGQRVVFSFPSRAENELMSGRLNLVVADVEGNWKKTVATGANDVSGITPAPDLKHLALTRRDGTVWIVPFNADEDATRVSTSAPNAKRVSSGEGYYVFWRSADQLTFGFSRDVYRYGLSEKVLDVLSISVRFEKGTAARPIVFQGARLITMSNGGGAGRIIESGTIVVDGRHISELGPSSDVIIPLNALIIDVEGKTIMPGLLDTHYHGIGGNLGFSALALPNASFDDEGAIAYGVTGAWEPGGELDDGVPATVDLQEAGRIVGPRWSYAAAGGVGQPYEYRNSYATIASAVEQYSRLGVAVLKEYNAPTRQLRQWLSKAAHESDLGIVSHLQDFDGMMTRVVDGYTGGDHPYAPAPLFKDVHEMLRQTGYIWTPNIGISGGSVSGHRDVSSYYWQRVFEARPGEFEKLERVATADAVRRLTIPPNVPYETHRVSRVAKQAATAAKNGVHIGVSAHNMPGSRLHAEMWYLWKGGLPIEDVLRAATIGNAEKLGLQEEIGSLEVGKIADFLVLDENPLDSILNTLSLKYTVQDGTIYHSNSMKKAALQ